jgi:microcystin-dependent protein
MKPLNLDNSPCSPISSNCVIWQGKDLPCIKLCTGDTVSDVVFKLATELCAILDELNISNYDLACLNLPCGPDDFQGLIQILIQKICDLENIPVPTPSGGDSCCSTPVAVASCLGGGSATLTDYVNIIGLKICDILQDINDINTVVANLDTRVDILENTPAPVFTMPTVLTTCTIGTIPPLLAPGTHDIDVVLQRFINEEWCPLEASLGTASALSAAVLTQCVDGVDSSLKFQYSVPGTQMQIAYPSYVASPTTVADAINNLWIALCDTREAGKETAEVVAGANITVSSSTAVVGNDQVTTYTVIGQPGIPVGSVIPYAGIGSIPPTGWAFCDGQSLLKATYLDLWNAIGYTYGGGGASFNIPNLEQRIPVHQGTNAGGYTLNTIGATGGAVTHTLTQAQIPTHTHDLSSGTASGTLTAPLTGTVTGTCSGTTSSEYAPLTTAINDGSSPADDGRIRIAADGGLTSGDTRQQTAHDHTFSGVVTGTVSGSASGPFTASLSGDTGNGTPNLQGQAHGNMQPYLIMRYIIKL